MTDPRKDEYKGSNPYVLKGDRPGPDSPRGRLPVPHRQVWAALQDGLRNLPRMRESVVWCGEGWKWTWQYSFRDRPLAYLMPSERGVSAVLVVDGPVLDTLLARDDVRPSIRGLLKTVEPEGECRQCWTPVLDVDTARDFLLSVRALLEVTRALTKGA